MALIALSFSFGVRNQSSLLFIIHYLKLKYIELKKKEDF